MFVVRFGIQQAYILFAITEPAKHLFLNVIGKVHPNVLFTPSVISV